MTSQTNTQKAKSILRKYQILSVFSLLIFIFLSIFALYFIENRFLGLAVLIIALLVFRFALFFIFYRMIWDPLADALDAPLYHEIIRRGRMGHASGWNQAQAEYYVGNYTNAIAICKQKLSEPRYAKTYRYHYYYCLANCYFDLGDDQKLKEICDLFYRDLTGERKREKIFKQFSTFRFFSVYLNRNTEACEEYLRQPVQNNLLRVSAEFKKARVALLCGDETQAKNSFESVIRKAPLLHYAVISEKVLQAMENGGGYADAIAPIPEEETEQAVFWAVQKLSSSAPVFRKITNILIWISVFLILAGTVLNRIVKEIEEDSSSYYEELETLVANDYDGVEILDVFQLEKGEFWVDTLFLALTEDSVLIASYYSYTGEDSLYYTVLDEIPLSAFLSEDFTPITQEYKAVTSDYWIQSGFYENRSEIPENYYSVRIRIQGKTFRFVVTDLKSEKLVL